MFTLDTLAPLLYTEFIMYNSSNRNTFQRHSDFNRLFVSGTTELMLSCKNGNYTEFLNLVNNGADIHAVNAQGENALMFACHKHLSNADSLKIVKYLIENGVDVNAQDIKGKNALINVCMNNSRTLSTYLISHGADINAKDNSGHSALMYACERTRQNPTVAKELIDNGADIHAIDNHGQTALMYACQSGNFELYQYLVNKGADILARDNSNMTTLMHACFSYRNKRDYRGIIEHLLNHVDINATTDTNRNALSYACSRGNLMAVEILINNGANINHVDLLNRTPLMLACAKGNIEIVRLLLWRDKIDVNATNNQNNTALDIARANNHTDIVDLLENTQLSQEQDMENQLTIRP